MSLGCRRWRLAWLGALAVWTILATLACGKGPEGRIARIGALSRRPTAANLDRIRALLEDPEGEVRLEAIEALASIPTEDAVDRAVHGLADPDGSVRAGAASCLGDLRAETAVPLLVAQLLSDADRNARLRAADALVAISGSEAVDGLIRALDDPVPAIRLAAVQACGRLDPGAALGALARIVLDDPDWRIRAEAARAIGGADRADARTALEAARGDPNEFVRATAAAALRRLGTAPPRPRRGSRIRRVTAHRRRACGLSSVYSRTRLTRRADRAESRTAHGER